MSTGVVERVVNFTAADGLGLNLVNVRGSGHLGPVLVVHGAGVGADLFRAPVERNFVDVLVDEGYDVWLENWRASTDPGVKDTNWNLDEAAVYDHPAAVRTVIAETGAETLKAVVHCQGSTSFCMSALAGLVPQVDTILSSAVGSHISVPWWSKVKLDYAVPLMSRITDSLDPSQGDQPKGKVQKAVTLAVKLTHRECSDTACRMVSFTYGAGAPALWKHENLNDETHHPFVQEQFGRVPVSFFMQMRECAAAGQLVRVTDLTELPERFADQPPQTNARFVLFTGDQNQCFTPDSQRRMHQWLDGFEPGRHQLHLFPGYSHLDVFFGQNAAVDVFPTLLSELAAGPSPVGSQIETGRP